MACFVLCAAQNPQKKHDFLQLVFYMNNVYLLFRAYFPLRVITGNTHGGRDDVQQRSPGLTEKQEHFHYIASLNP